QVNPLHSRRLVEHHYHPESSVVAAAIRTIGNILTGDDLQTQVMLNVSAIPAFYALLSHPGDNIRKEACWSISNVLAGNQMQIQSVIDAGVISTIIKLLDKAETKIRREAAWSITNAVSGGNAFTML
ncbi:Karyopherin alpha 6like, partial [Caligus rogercresseyi]